MSWLEFQRRYLQQPGLSLAIGWHGETLRSHAAGLADEGTGGSLTADHRFRVASHSKTFTAAGIMLLRDRGRLKLDDKLSLHIDGLTAAVGGLSVGSLLSHGSGLTRDGTDGDHWSDRRPFPSLTEFRAGLRKAPTLKENARFKYSNFGFGLLGLLIEHVTGEPYVDWMAREVVAAAGLRETFPDFSADIAKLATGHSARLPVGERVAILGRNPTAALAGATGFISTASDLARFFAQLDPTASRSILSEVSRRAMVRRLRSNPGSSIKSFYGLGTMAGTTHGWRWFGHGGAFQGFISRTIVLTGTGISISVLTNAVDGAAHAWTDGVMQIFRRFADKGPPQRRLADWTGRWWSLWGAQDLVAIGDRVLIGLPALAAPFTDATEIVVTGRDRGKIAAASGYGSFGETALLHRSGKGRVNG